MRDGKARGRWYREPLTPVVTDPAEVATIASAIAASPLATFDLEFLAQDRLVPTLCLIQVSWLPAHTRLDVPAPAIVATPPEVALVDPLAVDVGPIVRALAAHPCVVAHAPRQDLALLAIRFGVEMTAIVDTQIMAAFAGIGEQVGLATLANELLGLSLGKEQQWTNWARRPLSEAQLTYADADVRHLPAIYAILRARLGERMEWARAESALVAADALAATQVTPETAWRQLGGLRGLEAPALAAAIELAAWRFRTATELDRPLGQVLHDKLVVEIARHRPRTAVALRSAKGLSPIARDRADEILAAIAAARPAEAPVLSPGRAPGLRAQRWSEILLAITQHVAEQTGVAVRLLATRADAEEFARKVDEHGIEAAHSLPALATWRREILGQLWLDWLTGTVVLVGDLAAPAGIQLLPR